MNQKKHGLIYYSKCLEPSCTEDYLGQTGHRIKEQTANHTGKDKQSHLFPYTKSTKR